jgi:excinuclease ABC subunit C
MELSEQVANLPLKPGVYLFHDAAGKILYVGKARSLRQRVRSYFLESNLADAKTGSLVREIAEIETIVLDNEKEALALENNLIKGHQPKFNVLLRDDKTYPYIRYTAFEKYPRVYVTRRLTKDGAVYFGPYFPARLAYRLVHLIHKHFLVPSCSVDLTLPAILHSPVSRALRRRSDHRRPLRRSGPRRPAVSRRAAARPGTKPGRPHDERVG